MMGVCWINDSKATNVDSVYWALDSLSGNIIWIAGGLDKGNDYTAIQDLVRTKVKAMVALGKKNETILTAFRDVVARVYDTHDMESAIKIVKEIAEFQDTVLLSPACLIYFKIMNTGEIVLKIKLKTNSKFMTSLPGIQQLNESFKADRVLWTIILLLSAFSLLAVFSASNSITRFKTDTTLYFMMKHVPFIVLGITTTWATSKIHYNEFNRLAPYLLILAIVLLVITLFFGVNINQAKRWLYVPFTDITFQVSDYAKIALVAYLARSISVKQDYIKDFKSAFVPLLLPVIIVCGLIAPSNFSTAALLFGTLFSHVVCRKSSITSLGWIGRPWNRIIWGLISCGYINSRSSANGNLDQSCRGKIQAYWRRISSATS